MAPEDDASLELEQEILPDRVDPFESPAGEAGGKLECLGARMRGLDLDALPDERLQPGRGTVEAVALRHDPSVPFVPKLSNMRSGVPSSMNIAALARRTGVRPDTLRKWENRYGVIEPVRTSGGQRRYSALDVARVEWLQARLAEGYRIGEAAALLGSSELEPVPQAVEQLREALYSSAAKSDASGLERLVAQALEILPVEEAIGEVLVPVLQRIGAGWADGELTVGQEHLASGVVRAHLDRLLADQRGSARGVAVLACAPGERHELGLLMLAILMRADGWQVAYLGSDTPVADACSLAADIGARLLCISTTMADTLLPLTNGLGSFELQQQTSLVLGGAAITAEHAQALGGRLGPRDPREAVAALRRMPVAL